MTPYIVVFKMLMFGLLCSGIVFGLELLIMEKRNLKNAVVIKCNVDA